MSYGWIEVGPLLRLIAAVFYAMVIGFAAARPARAVVSPKNGNFFIGYTDISYGGDAELSLGRVYNSKSAFNGLFGWGWGSEYDTFLVAQPDGTIVVHESGGGASNVFTAVDRANSEIDGALALISRAQPELSAGDRERLRQDARFRHDTWERVRSTSKVPEVIVPDNRSFVSHAFGEETLVHRGHEFVATRADGRRRRFDARGHLIEISHDHGTPLYLTYDEKRRLSHISDGLRTITLVTDPAGRIVRAMGTNDRYAEYRYSPAGDLIWSRDAQGNVYAHEYSADGRHNMTRIGYSDGTSLVVWYYSVQANEGVRRIRDRQGEITDYEYGERNENGTDHLWSEYRISSPGGLPHKVRYDYFEAIDQITGSPSLVRTIQSVDGSEVDTTFDHHGSPTKVVRDGLATDYAYDANSRLISKTSASTRVSYSYSLAGKVSRVEIRSTRDAPSAAARTWFSYEHDDRGALASAASSDGRQIRLTNDASGRITTMRVGEKELQFDYAANSKPRKITLAGVGSIEITYADSGILRQTTGEQARRVSVEVAESYRLLMELVRPSHVEREQ